MPRKKESLAAPEATPKRRTAQLAEYAFQRLRQAILTRELDQGDTVREQRLARDWKIGRTPMREAVRRAAEFGYIILRPNQAPTVRRLSAEDIRQIYSIRELLECYALRDAYPNITTEDLRKLRVLADKAERSARGRLTAQLAFDTALHELWINHSGNTWLVYAMERLLIYRPNLAHLLVTRRELADQVFEEHKAILAALETRHLRLATKLLGQHIKQAGLTLAELAHTPQPSARAAPRGRQR